MRELLIDADSLAYRLGFRFQDLSVNDFDVEDGPFKADSKDKINAFSDIIDKELKSWMELTSTKSYQLHVSYKACIDDLFKQKYFRENQRCFRYQEARVLPKAYKHNRSKIHIDTPWKSFLLAMVQNFSAEVHDYVEADDVVVRLKLDDPTLVLAAIDKDVLFQCPGIHFNYYKNDFEDVSENEARFYKYWQCLIGDTSDGYSGAKGIGKARASSLINKEMSDVDLWERIKSVFLSKGQSIEEAIATMRLADMSQLKSFDKNCKSVDRYNLELFNDT